MAVFRSKERKREREKENRVSERLTGKEKRISSVDSNPKRKKSKKKRFAILREITWPSFPSAVIQALGSACAVAVLGTLIYLFDFGVNQLIALIV